ncbi:MULTISPECIES: hypothetical protein [unclassified Microcoleus]|nr:MULTISPECIES: hypothetical protein [unclassified Microcoleus]
MSLIIGHWAKRSGGIGRSEAEGLGIRALVIRHSVGQLSTVNCQ